MAVKLMVAPAIANGALEKPTAAKRGGAPAPAKPKRRRSSVYDADGSARAREQGGVRCVEHRHGDAVRLEQSAGELGVRDAPEHRDRAVLRRVLRFQNPLPRAMVASAAGAVQRRSAARLAVVRAPDVRAVR